MTTTGRAAVLLVALGASACCDEQVKVLVLPGHQELRTCIETVQAGKSSPVTVACGGKEVTVCWGSNVKDVKLEPMGITSHGTQAGSKWIGVEYYTPTADVTVKAIASDCASATQDVKVITGDTPVRFDASWHDEKCTSIDYVLDPSFVDPAARAISITALWRPLVTDANGNPVECKTPPFLDGFKKPDLFGFKIDAPFLTRSFTQPLQLGGEWDFLLQVTCPAGNYACDRSHVFPFSTTVRCVP